MAKYYNDSKDMFIEYRPGSGKMVLNYGNIKKDININFSRNVYKDLPQMLVNSFSEARNYINLDDLSKLSSLSINNLKGKTGNNIYSVGGFTNKVELDEELIKPYVGAKMPADIQRKMDQHQLTGTIIHELTHAFTKKSYDPIIANIESIGNTINNLIGVKSDKITKSTRNQERMAYIAELKYYTDAMAKSDSVMTQTLKNLYNDTIDTGSQYGFKLPKELARNY